jgi:hypothetical protein
LGWPSIAPEKLLRELVHLLFRCFVGLNMVEPVWVPSVFSKNRDRSPNGDIAEKLGTLQRPVVG